MYMQGLLIRAPEIRHGVDLSICGHLRPALLANSVCSRDGTWGRSGDWVYISCNGQIRQRAVDVWISSNCCCSC